MKSPRGSYRLPRFLRLRRRPLAALCTFVAVLAGLLALSPRSTEGVPVVMSAGALSAGTVLARGDLTVRSLPPEAIPQAAAVTVDSLVGQTLAAPVSGGTILTEASVATGERLARPGWVVIALPLPSGGIAELVRPGVEIDLIGADGKAVASQVRVLTAPEASSAFGSSSRAALIEVQPQVAGALAQTAQSGSLTIAVR